MPTRGLPVGPESRTAPTPPWLILPLVVLVLSAYACSGALGIRTASPYERYIDALKQSGLDQTALGVDWTRVGLQALDTPVAATLPFREEGYFAPEDPSAVAYRMELRRGRQLIVDVQFVSSQPGRLFVDLFETAANQPHRRVGSLDAATNALTYEVNRDGAYLLRVQPELLRGGRFTIVERTVSSLVFPVSGLTARAVQSEFGADRSGGARDHEGIDIFAPRGTPVVAAVDGIARQDTNNLGGNVVWLHDARTRRRFYYAHLDRWAADRASSVRAGDVVGYVGNTGNARTTSPHLHFGIYEGGAIDPWPFVQPDDAEPPPAVARVDRLGELARVSSARVTLRDGPHTGAATRRQLDRGSVVRIVGLSARAVRVTLPDDSIGYLDAASVIAAEDPLRRQRLVAGTALLERPSVDAPVVDVVAGDLQGEVLGQFGGFTLVRVPDDRRAWIKP